MIDVIDSMLLIKDQHTSHEPVIRMARDSSDLLAISRFRYRIYVEEMKRPQKDADHDQKTIVDTLDTPQSFIMAAWNDDDVVGTVRLNLIRDGNIGNYAELYGLNSLSQTELIQASITTRLMVHPQWRTGPLPIRLATELFRLGLQNQIRWNFIDCNKPLVNFFSSLGYKMFKPDLMHPDYGQVYVMRLDITDVEHLAAVRSPFLTYLNSIERNLKSQPSL